MTDDRLPSDQSIRLAIEVTLGIGPDKSMLPDTPAVRAARATLKTEIDAVIARGHTPDVPFE